MEHALEITRDALTEALDRWPRVVGLVLGLALHPILSACLRP